MATRLRQAVRDHWERKDFAYVGDKAGAISGFTPGGPGGQRLVEEIYSLQKKAGEALGRRDKLRRLIPMEITAQDYEHARSHIQEYDTLADDDMFAEQAAGLDQKLVRRDITRARRAMEKGNWQRAIDTCQGILRKVDPENREARRLLGLIRFRRFRHWVFSLTGLCLLLLAAYVLSAAPVFHYLGRPETGVYYRVYRYAAPFHENALAREPLKRYAAIWGGVPVFEIAKPEPPAGGTPVSSEPPVERLTQLRAGYEKGLIRIAAEYTQKRDTLPEDYVKKLEQLQNDMQRAGDYDGWEATQMELSRFEETLDVGEKDITEETEALAVLQMEYVASKAQHEEERENRLRAATDNYLKTLRDLRASYTKKGEMEKAKTVNAEIDRVEFRPDAPPRRTGFPFHLTPAPSAASGDS
jgi:hypothetical protein